MLNAVIKFILIVQFVHILTVTAELKIGAELNDTRRYFTL